MSSSSFELLKALIKQPGDVQTAAQQNYDGQQHDTAKKEVTLVSPHRLREAASAAPSQWV